MAIDKTYGALRRRNVSPTSSVLRTVTRDFDCSALAFPPEDGSFICTAGDAATVPKKKFFDDGGVDATDYEGSSLRMVWASALQTDRQVLRDSRVPVLWLGGIEVECKLYNADKAANLNAGANFVPGAQVSVQLSKTAYVTVGGVSDAGERLVLCPVADNTKGWMVGYVAKAPAVDPDSGEIAVTIHLYDQPRKVGSF